MLPGMGGSCSSDNTDPLQHNNDVLVNRDTFGGGLPDNSGGSKVALGKPCSI